VRYIPYDASNFTYGHIVYVGYDTAQYVREGQDAEVDSGLYKSTNSAILELEFGDSSCKEAEVDSDLYKSTTSSIMVPESADGKDPSSSPSHGAEEDSELYKTIVSTPMESEYSVLSPRIDAGDGTTLFSKTSSKSSQLEEQVRAVTQTQTSALKNSTKSELKAVLALLAKDIL
jgi:hypothetical protein